MARTPWARSAMGIVNSRGVLPGTRGRVGAQRVQRLVWTPVRAHGAAARVAHLSASTWPAQHPAAAPRTPSSSRRGRAPPTRAMRETARRMDRARPRARARSTRSVGRSGRLRASDCARGAAELRPRSPPLTTHHAPPCPLHLPPWSCEPQPEPAERLRASASFCWAELPI